MKQPKDARAPVWPTVGGQPLLVTVSSWDLIPEVVLCLWLCPVSPAWAGAPPGPDCGPAIPGAREEGQAPQGTERGTEPPGSRDSLSPLAGRGGRPPGFQQRQVPRWASARLLSYLGARTAKPEQAERMHRLMQERRKRRAPGSRQLPQPRTPRSRREEGRRRGALVQAVG